MCRNLEIPMGISPCKSAEISFDAWTNSRLRQLYMFLKFLDHQFWNPHCKQTLQVMKVVSKSTNILVHKLQSPVFIQFRQV